MAGCNILYEAYSSSDDNTTIMSLYSFIEFIKLLFYYWHQLNICTLSNSYVEAQIPNVMVFEGGPWKVIKSWEQRYII